MPYYLECEYGRHNEWETLSVSHTSHVERLAQRFDVTTKSSVPAVSTVALSPKQGEETNVTNPSEIWWVALCGTPTPLGLTSPTLFAKVARHAHDACL